MGFPGETEHDFEETLSLVRECAYDGLYLFKYSKRSGTPAANMPDDVPEEVKSERFLELERVQREAQRQVYSSYVGRVLSVLVERKSSRSADDMVGHSTCHKVVNFPASSTLEGEIVDVRVTETKPNSLYGMRIV